MKIWRGFLALDDAMIYRPCGSMNILMDPCIISKFIRSLKSGLMI